MGASWITELGEAECWGSEKNCTDQLLACRMGSGAAMVAFI